MDKAQASFDDSSRALTPFKQERATTKGKNKGILK